MKIALVANGGFDRTGREAVIPALLNLVARLARRHEVHVFTLAQYPEPCTYSLMGATIHNLAALPAPTGNTVTNQATRRPGRQRRLAGQRRAGPGPQRRRAAAPDDPRLRGCCGRCRACCARCEPTGPFDLLHAYMGMPAAAVAMVRRPPPAPALRRHLRRQRAGRPAGDRLRPGPQLPRPAAPAGSIARAADRITVSTLYMSLLAREQGLTGRGDPAGRGPGDGAAPVARHRGPALAPPARRQHQPGQGPADAAAGAGPGARPGAGRAPAHRRHRHPGRGHPRPVPTCWAWAATSPSRARCPPTRSGPITPARTCCCCPRATRPPASPCWRRRPAACPRSAPTWATSPSGPCAAPPAPSGWATPPPSPGPSSSCCAIAPPAAAWPRRPAPSACAHNADWTATRFEELYQQVIAGKPGR